MWQRRISKLSEYHVRKIYISIMNVENIVVRTSDWPDLINSILLKCKYVLNFALVLQIPTLIGSKISNLLITNSDLIFRTIKSISMQVSLVLVTLRDKPSSYSFIFSCRLCWKTMCTLLLFSSAYNITLKHGLLFPYNKTRNVIFFFLQHKAALINLLPRTMSSETNEKGTWKNML